MIRNEQNQVAIAYRQPIPHIVKVNGTTYVFDVKRAVSMAWINDEHVADILKITRRCCGGHMNPAYHEASQGQVNIWSGLER